MEIQKPSTLNSIWAVAGERVKPDDSKIQQGWVVEIPPLQYENWIGNRRDTALAHINQHGIPTWDQYTRYIAGKSYVQGSDGFIYKALTDNFNANPITDSNSWTTAFVSADSPGSVKLFNGYIVISSDINVTTNSRYYSLTSTTLTLPATASVGDNIIINKSPSAEVTVEVEGGSEIATLLGLADAVVLDVTDEINLVWIGDRWQTS